MYKPARTCTDLHQSWQNMTEHDRTQQTMTGHMYRPAQTCTDLYRPVQIMPGRDRPWQATCTNLRGPRQMDDNYLNTQNVYVTPISCISSIFSRHDCHDGHFHIQTGKCRRNSRKNFKNRRRLLSIYPWLTWREMLRLCWVEILQNQRVFWPWEMGWKYKENPRHLLCI